MLFQVVCALALIQGSLAASTGSNELPTLVEELVETSENCSNLSQIFNDETALLELSAHLAVNAQEVNSELSRSLQACPSLNIFYTISCSKLAYYDYLNNCKALVAEFSSLVGEWADWYVRLIRALENCWMGTSY